MTVPDPPVFPRLSEEDRAALVALSERPPGALRTRSRVVLACAEGLDNAEIALQLRLSPATVAKWRERFLGGGVAGLRDAPRSGRPRSTDRRQAEAHIAGVLEQAGGGSPVPSTRALAETLDLSQSTVARIWREQQARLPGPRAPRPPQNRPEAEREKGEPPMARVPRQLLSDHVYAQLRGWIVSGRLEPGQRLVESDIARRFGTSQAPPREAIKRLAHEGLVVSQPHRGTYVARISERQAQDVRDIRVMFEEYAARRVTGALDAEHDRLLADDVERLRGAAAQGDIGAFRDADMSFHRHVCEATGNAALIRLWRMIESSLWELHVLGDPRYVGGWTAMAEHHAELLDVLRSGDPEAAGPMFADHAAGEVLRYLPEAGTPAAP
ncbi:MULTISPECIES: GntR family transcriptional regulator [Streptomyces]|uniref:GntR family transcriptional regulator n=1 Tax=Streptomyces edwardsiae TaxID=3075527 RepID=A0ABU2QAB5_9ACTN|nr:MULTISPECIES: GntR family transcriptional regulator [unclassified Streptomyces]MDT0401402.1 GntR family transcriptional regulator [Streptomyces sp. DSM 41635]